MPPSKNANLIFIVVSPSLILEGPIVNLVLGLMLQVTYAVPKNSTAPPHFIFYVTTSKYPKMFV